MLQFVLYSLPSLKREAPLATFFTSFFTSADTFEVCFHCLGSSLSLKYTAFFFVEATKLSLDRT